MLSGWFRGDMKKASADLLVSIKHYMYGKMMTAFHA